MAFSRRCQKEGIDFYSSRMKDLEARHKRDDQLNYFSLLIEQSPSFALFKKGSSERVAEIKADTRERQVEDNLNAVNQSVAGGISQFFGNVVGWWRKEKGNFMMTLWSIKMLWRD